MVWEGPGERAREREGEERNQHTTGLESVWIGNAITLRTYIIFIANVH